MAEINPQILYCYPELAGSSFEPSNGTEGMVFTESFCEQCIHQHPDPDHEKQCMILMRTLIYHSRDSEYPKEWIFNAKGWPVCTSWHKWDWGNDGDPDDRDNPKFPGPPSGDPNQLLMPFDIWDLLGVTDAVLVTSNAVIERELIESNL